MRRWGLLATLLAALAAGAVTSGAPARVAVAPTFTLVTSPTCDTKNGEKNVGRACVNPNAVLAPAAHHTSKGQETREGGHHQVAPNPPAGH
ncbi:MAG: hypothetical protein ACXWYS_06235 [Gaiellaceae bacterium]